LSLFSYDVKRFLTDYCYVLVPHHRHQARVNYKSKKKILPQYYN